MKMVWLLCSPPMRLPVCAMFYTESTIPPIFPCQPPGFSDSDDHVLGKRGLLPSHGTLITPNRFSLSKAFSFDSNSENCLFPSTPSKY
jgi:hypothetical protein